MITICGFFSVEDGWEPLCRLLDKPIPDEPFPRANDAAAVESFFKSMVLKRLLRRAHVFTVVFGLLSIGL